LDDQKNPSERQAQVAASRRLDIRSARMAGIQNRVYTGLMIFVVVIGVPLLGIPSVRNRLYTRVHSVYGAFGPLALKIPPAWAKVGENRHPVPVEFERPVVSRPEFPRLVTMPNTVIRLGGDVAVESSRRADSRGEATQESEATAPAAPVYSQGKPEQEAYDLLLKSSEAISSLVKGSNVGLRFKTWGAAKVDDDAFLVNLTFVQISDSSEVQYIWRVKPSSREISPLSRNARALSSR
jgi:hypothetical protein